MVSEKNISWFHCGHCGSLFQSPAGEMDDRLCSACGCNPSLGLERPTLESALPQNGHSAGLADHPAHLGEHEKKPLRKRRRSYLMIKLVLGWSLLLFAIVFGARKLLHEESLRPAKPEVSQTPGVAVISEQDVAFLNEAGPLYNKTFANFMATRTPEERNQFVREPITTAARMARFYSMNPLVYIDPATISLANSAVLQLPGSKAIETLWRSADGHLMDAVFFEDSGEWRLDWDHFARFSDYPWALFLAGSELDHGVFRLLARERLANERQNADAISIVLYAPRFGFPGETGYQSSEFLIKRDTRNGRLLDAAFKLERSGGRVFGVNLPRIDPEGHIRVRVKVRRIEQDLERRFELEEVLACHWYSVEDPGVEIPDQPAGK